MPVTVVAAGAVGPVYDAASTAYFAAMTVQPSDTRKSLLNNAIVGLKADGVWAALDWISFVAAHDAQAGRVNAKNPAQVAAVVGGPAFTVDRGWAGVLGTAGYLDTGVAGTAGGSFAQDSASVFAWSDTATANQTGVMGQAADVTVRLLTNSGGSLSARINNGGAATLAVANGIGLTTASRLSSTTATVYRNTSGASTALTSIALSNSTFTPLCINGSYADVRVLAFGFGGGLSGAQVAALYARLNTYLIAVGAA